MPIGCVATRRCAGWSATGLSPDVLPRPARWAALRPSGWLDRRTLLPLPICPAGGSTLKALGTNGSPPAPETPIVAIAGRCRRRRDRYRDSACAFRRETEPVRPARPLVGG